MSRFLLLLLCAGLTACAVDTQPVAASPGVAVLELSISVNKIASEATRIERPASPPRYSEDNDLTLTAFTAATPPTLAQGHLELLQLPDIWQENQAEGIVVAVIDSGVDAGHAALQEAILPGYDFVLDRSQIHDPSGHGTAVAALIAGRGPQWGIAPAAKILPLRVLDEYNLGSSSDLARAILYAGNLLPDLVNPYPADVINLSLGGYGYNTAIHEAIRQVTEVGIVVLAATGNNGQERVAFPADLPETIAVGAASVKQGSWLATPYSNYGAGLDIVAPLGGLTATNKDTYAESGVLSSRANTVVEEAWFHGTSYAVAQATGIAALLLAMGVEDVAAHLRLSSSSVTLADWDLATGYGLINPRAALGQARTRLAEGELVVQVLDGNSFQELLQVRGSVKQRLELPTGHYHLRVWQDDGDGLRQLSEPIYRSLQPFRVYSGMTLKQSLELH